ncbi:MAG TPA: hypothetical protein VJL29_04275 [Thermoguttaceae bacterium]|nr:hypothetical protein [Thermoguttaceae bacterium]
MSELRRPRGKGFTLMELMIVSMMTTFLAMLFASAWAGFGQPSADTLVRCQIAQEAQLAVTSLAADLGGSLPNAPTGVRENGRLVGRLSVGSQLKLCFDGGDLNGTADWTDPDVVITYYVNDDNQLVRWNETADTDFVVASNVESMSPTDRLEGVRIDLTFLFRNESRTYTLITEDPW